MPCTSRSSDAPDAFIEALQHPPTTAPLHHPAKPLLPEVLDKLEQVRDAESLQTFLAQGDVELMGSGGQVEARPGERIELPRNCALELLLVAAAVLGVEDWHLRMRRTSQFSWVW